jgi:signal transduction histidine kinase
MAFSFRRSRDDGSTESKFTSSIPDTGESRAELALKAAELADRLRIVHEHQAIVARDLVTLVSRTEGTAFASFKNQEALDRQSRMIVDAARTALSDMRRAMTVAHQGFDSVEVWPTLESISDLFAEGEEQGLVIDFEEVGDRFPLSASAELAVYRILTEAIDNAREHGGPGTEVDVLMTWTEHGLTVKVNDDGEQAQARRAAAEGGDAPAPVTIESDQAALTGQTTGRGLLEMKSRAEAFDGTVLTQRVPGVGFVLTASFPMLRYATDPKAGNELGS